MQLKKVNSILKEVLEKIEPSKEDLKLIDDSLREILKRIKEGLKKQKIKAEVFIGGSFAKNTVIKKDKYDVDVFIRFDKKYKGKDISKITGEIIKEAGDISIIHGSRDYFKIKISPEINVEVIPVIKVSNPKDSENITDLSYSHVKYIRDKIKSDKLVNDIRIAKAFCHANQCYGAESYIKGFSGYALELLVFNYKGFINFLEQMLKVKEQQVIDIEKYYKNKKQVMLDLNSSKLDSPIILIDPTFKQRNALAALSKETFKKFQEAAKRFLSNPTINAFESKRIDKDKIKGKFGKKAEVIFLSAETEKQEGDIAGSKLLKFYKHLEKEIGKYFIIKESSFEYESGKKSVFYYAVKKKKEILLNGPKLEDKKNVESFKKEHKNVFEKDKRIYSKEKVNFTIKEFLDSWKRKNNKKIKQMYIKNLSIIEK